MKELCGMDCCTACTLYGNGCAGCFETDGHPCNGVCVAAEEIRGGGREAMLTQKAALIDEINGLGIPELTVDELYLLNGSYVNLEYPLPNGQTVKLLQDNKVYWGCQVEREGNDRCYGVVADEAYLLVCEYGCNGADPALLLYRKRAVR